MIKYHFFGKECAVDKVSIDYSALENGLLKQDFKSKFPIVLVNQVHGNNVLLIDDETKIPTGKLVDADAIVTNLKNLTIGILTADCMPILFFDEKNSVIAAVHAGWQGAFKNITDNAIDEMLKIGADIQNIKAIIGPCIRQNSYEIDQNFYDRLVAENPANEKFFNPSMESGHYLFNLPSYTKEKLIKKGIKNISDDEIDTYEKENLFSYRRNTHHKINDELRNISVIQIVD